MKGHILIPLAAVLFFQTLLLAVFYRYGGVLTTLRNNAVSIFVENTEQKRVNMERELVQRWMSSVWNTEEIVAAIEQIIAQEGADAKSVAEDPALNERIIHGTMDQMIELLHRSYGNGVYLILDGPSSANGHPEDQAGVCIRDLDVSSYALDNSDLLLARGLPSISRDYNIALDSAWKIGFNRNEMINTDFYDKPFEAAAGHRIGQHEMMDYVYFGELDLRESGGVRMLSWSVPLVLSDGSVIGVAGGEIMKSRVRELLNITYDAVGQDVLRLIARGDLEEGNLIPVVTDRAVFEHYFGKQDQQRLTGSATDWDSVYTLKDVNGSSWYAVQKPLQIYGSKTPFADETWRIVQLQQEDSLFSDVNVIQRILMLSVAVSLLIGLLALWLVGNLLASPVRRLLQEVRHTKLNQEIRLKKINIEEVDVLVDEINRLNASAMEYNSKISRILDVSDLDIGVFEYKHDSELVFCSRSLLKLLDMPCGEELYEFMDRTVFNDRLTLLKNPTEDENGKIYEFTIGPETRYIRMRCMKNEQDMTGVLVDVTKEVNERRKLESERNYDGLTSLYNRRAFREKLEPMLASGSPGIAAMVVCDLDNLKFVNDTYGHEFGDRYICRFAEHLRTLETDGAIVERRSGDEFEAFLFGGSEQDIWERMEDFMERLKTVRMELPGGDKITLKASVGVSWYPRQAVDYETLARYADYAMYLSKHSFKGMLQEFDLEAYRKLSQN